MNHYTADKMCSVLKVSSNSFYKWLTKKSSHREEKSKKLIQLIQDEFEKVLNLNDIHQSMSRKWNCWDNSVAESFLKTLKTELVYHHKFENREIAKMKIFEYIEGFYHNKRIHSAIGNLTPNQMEKHLKQNQKIAA